MVNVLRFSDVTYVRNGRSILGGVDWSVESDERWVILGPNGAGKTTMLKLATTGDYPTTGEVPPELITSELVVAFAGAVARHERQGAVDRANAALRRADPASGKPDLVSHEEVSPWDVTAGEPYWHDVLHCARRKGPRTLAAFLTTASTVTFSDEARRDRDELLKYLWNLKGRRSGGVRLG